jgi:uncharacterized protein YyaL (SSP411 family)
VRIARLDEDEALEARVRAFLAATGDLPARAPQAFGNVLCLASALLAGSETIAIAGSPDDPAARALGLAAIAAAGPETVVSIDPSRPSPDGPAAYLCRGTTCLPPVGDADALRNLLTEA